MSTLTQEDRQLLVEAAFAAVNHGMQLEVSDLLNALPWLIEDMEDRAMSGAVLLWSIGKAGQALESLAGLDSAHALLLRAMITHGPSGELAGQDAHAAPDQSMTKPQGSEKWQQLKH
ncbi:EscG/YscG/SsaH family type III secretion system needle protein co-chaperone [Chitinimonas arctica]|uniref:EscG/YscG/SsaH family type III secretion system needle protein co-chaperone n=1 Tax=Chitinimonas arctica TaxID=2594795 RepID=A0A516SA99_9NEIS|nr:EscG/YscG/SsaH family type III secretion system needle protein co-chaperone [Chitinimonas arctica]QDQ25074.1 EscG/YscG/SsaH family type III secretion system needle protein co-chaperone [Chitinimonas arctica]